MSEPPRPKPQFRLREIAGDDLAGIAELFAAAAIDGGGVGWSATAIGRSLDAGGRGAVAISGEERMLGAIVLVAAGDDFDVGNIAVPQDVRRAGVGRALIAWAAETARSAGRERIVLEVAADNAPAQTLYERQGFRQIGLRKGYYVRDGRRVDARVLALSTGGSVRSFE